MGIFGRSSARQRLRRATAESLSVPTFSAPLDCSPWVIGGLWPPELSAGNGETAKLAAYLKTDLQRIAATANEDLRRIGQTGMAYPARRAAEARVIDEARALALRRVESTLRQLRQSPEPARPAARPASPADLDKTQVLPTIRDEPPIADMDKTQVIPAVRDEDPAPGGARTDRAAGGEQQLPRLLAFVARQESRLSWAVGERADGSTLLVTDLAHGWIPPGIAIPDGVRLLEPDIRTGRAAQLLGEVTRQATYAPGDSAKLSADPHGTPTSVQPLELPPVPDLGWELGVATHWRGGLPRLVNTLAKAAAAGADIVEQELDLLRVHLDTTRYQLLAQYPEVDPAQLLNCMLLAATERSATGDATAANYHFSWFRKLRDASTGEPAE